MRHLMNRLPALRSILTVAFLTLACTAAAAQAVNHQNGFAGQTDLTFNGNASVQGTRAQLTPATNGQAGSFFTTAQVSISQFTTSFVFHELGTPGGEADGIGFCIQRVGPTALGGGGGLMGYQGIANSVFIKFDNYPNISATGMFQNGADPSTADTDMRPNVDIHTQHDFRVDMTYNGTTIAMSVTDLTTNGVYSTTFTVNIAAVIGGTTAYVGFTGATGGANANQEVLSWSYGQLPPPTALAAVNGRNQISLSWTASAGATSYTVLAGPASGGPYAQIATNVAGTTYVDNSATFPNTYYYVVFAVGAGGFVSSYSNVAVGTPLQPAITVSPSGPITTSEAGVNATLTLTINASPQAAGTIMITSNNPGQALVSGQGNGDGSIQGPAASITIHINNATPATTTFPITVYGVDDFVANGNQPYVISFTVAGGGANWAGATIPNVNGTNLEADTVGLLVNPTGGLITDTGGGQANFSVRLNSKPAPGTVVAISVTSSNTGEGMVSTAQLNFDPSNWNVAQPVTVTGQGTVLSYLNTPYAINLAVMNVANSDPAYAGLTASVSVLNIHLEVPPALPHVWGGSGSGGGGGCGLLGLESLLLMGAIACRRRRR